MAVVPINSETAEVAGEVEIVSRVSSTRKEQGDLIKQAQKQVVYCLKDMKGRRVTDWNFLRRKIEDTLKDSSTSRPNAALWSSSSSSRSKIRI